jgi:hypothetical protein
MTSTFCLEILGFVTSLNDMRIRSNLYNIQKFTNYSIALDYKSKIIETADFMSYFGHIKIPRAKVLNHILRKPTQL